MRKMLLLLVSIVIFYSCDSQEEKKAKELVRGYINESFDITKEEELKEIEWYKLDSVFYHKSLVCDIDEYNMYMFKDMPVYDEEIAKQKIDTLTNMRASLREEHKTKEFDPNKLSIRLKYRIKLEDGSDGVLNDEVFIFNEDFTEVDHSEWANLFYEDALSMWHK